MPPRDSIDLKSKISEKLNLDENQRELYFQLALSHRESLARVEKEQKPLLEEYFSSLKNQSDDSMAQDSLLNLIVGLDREKLTLTYSHFSELKKICNPDQTLAFDDIVVEITQVLVGGDKKSPPPPRD
ncbi:hypothetical protein [Algoriphagus sp.]|uniref:hypothetical protein n=1 Tax=Algoriphagus sp. TaxID=1872435 RepID=UPI0025E6BEC2|nr:hypothetical protein [Algoriphagus sp.]